MNKSDYSSIEAALKMAYAKPTADRLLSLVPKPKISEQSSSFTCSNPVEEGRFKGKPKCQVYKCVCKCKQFT